MTIITTTETMAMEIIITLPLPHWWRIYCLRGQVPKSNNNNNNNTNKTATMTTITTTTIITTTATITMTTIITLPLPHGWRIHCL